MARDPQSVAIMATSRSLLDDADFVAALEEMDIAEESSATRENGPHWICEPGPLLPAPPTEARGRIVLGVLGFTLMMGLGAAGAVVVFQDRIVQLLR